MTKDEFIAQGAALKAEIASLQGYLAQEYQTRMGFAVNVPADLTLVKQVADDALADVAELFTSRVQALLASKQEAFDNLTLDPLM